MFGEFCGDCVNCTNTIAEEAELVAVHIMHSTIGLKVGGSAANSCRHCFRTSSRDSTVGIAIGHWLDDRGVGVRVPVGSGVFSTSSRPAPGSTQPPTQWIPGALSLGVKRPGREADHSRINAEVKKMWIYISTPPYAFMA
jgi:hypothetical protein